MLLDGEPVRAVPRARGAGRGRRVDTVEGLADGDSLHAGAVARFAAERALQCGFCTPGFVVLAAWLAATTSPRPTRSAIRDVLSSNLCRCTGYAPIVAAVMSLRGQAP